MGILRKDYLTDLWVYYATERKTRPKEFRDDQKLRPGKVDFFAPGNENLTPPEIGRVEEKGMWKMRWFLNKFPAVDTEDKHSLKAKKFLIEGPTYGYHEIMVETRSKTRQLADLPLEDFIDLLEVYKVRIRGLSKKKKIKYITIFKNHGPNAGTSLIHSHTQLVALPQIPKAIADERAILKKKFRNPYREILKLESSSRRNVVNNEHVVAFCPFASRFNFEVWIYPNRHVCSLEGLRNAEVEAFASALRHMVRKLKELNASYNFYVHYDPVGNLIPVNIKITPRFAKWGGFELSTGAVINSVLPEDAAAFYRGKSK